MSKHVFKIFSSKDRIHQVSSLVKPVADPKIGLFFPTEVKQVGDYVFASLVKNGKGSQIGRVFEENGTPFLVGRIRSYASLVPFDSVR
jgi:hypothetical protein